MSNINFIPEYTMRSEQRRTREVVTNEDWNELWNLNSHQGDHSEQYLDALHNHLFGEEGFDPEAPPKIPSIDFNIDQIESQLQSISDAEINNL